MTVQRNSSEISEAPGIHELQDAGGITLRYRVPDNRPSTPTPRDHWLQERYGELRGEYFTWDPSLSIKEMLDRWVEYGAKGRDGLAESFELPTGEYFEAIYSAEELWPYRRDDRPVNPALVKGLEEHGWLSPVLLRIGRNGCVEVGEGNHRIRVGHDKRLQYIPVRLWFVQEAPCVSDRERRERAVGYERARMMEERERDVVPESIKFYTQDRELKFNKANSMKKVEQVFDKAFDKVEAEFPDFGTVELHEDEHAGADNGAGAERQFAYCAEGDPIVIAFAPKATELSESRLRGLMRHEFGHALEYRFGVKELERRLGRRLPEKVERRADVIAETVWGQPIVYDTRDIQCVGIHGKQRRPRRLPDEKAVLRANMGDAPGNIATVELTCIMQPEGDEEAEERSEETREMYARAHRVLSSYPGAWLDQSAHEDDDTVYEDAYARVPVERLEEVLAALERGGVDFDGVDLPPGADESLAGRLERRYPHGVALRANVGTRGIESRRRSKKSLPDELPEWARSDEKKLKSLYEKTQQGDGPKDWLDCLSDREIEEALFGFSSMRGTISLETDEIEWVDNEGSYEDVLAEVEEEGPDYYDTDSTIIIDLTWDGIVELNDGHHRYVANREHGDDHPMTAEVQIPPGLAREWARKLIASVETGAPGEAPPPVTVSQLEAEAGPASTWPGKCDKLAHAAAAMTGGRPVYGHWLGGVSESGYWADYARRPFVRHGWVELPDGRVLDPTRWSFEDVDPYIWVGENDGSYDEGGTQFYSALRSPPPENDPQGKQLPLGVSDRCAEYLNDILGRDNEPTASPRQLMWLANLSPDQLGDCAAELHDALEAAGLAGFIPVDYAQAVKSRR